jgi:hypothetical protein
MFAVVLHLAMRKFTTLVPTAMVCGRLAVHDALAAIGVCPAGQ